MNVPSLLGIEITTVHEGRLALQVGILIGGQAVLAVERCQLPLVFGSMLAHRSPFESVVSPQDPVSHGCARPLLSQPSNSRPTCSRLE